MLSSRRIKCVATIFYCFVAYVVVSTTVKAAALVDNSNSKFAKLASVDVEDVRWTGGFWKARTDVCFSKSIPSMWRLMRDGTYKPFLGHFLIAAGQAEGSYHGAKWNDGDFYKWLEAAIVANSIRPTPEMQQAIDTSVDAICAAQREDGYIHTPVLVANRNGDSAVQPFQDRHAFEMYNMGHLLTTASLHFRLTQDTRLLQAAEKAADFLYQTFYKPTPELARNSICPSHYMGVIELYRTTGNPKHLELAKIFLEMRNLVTSGGDDNQDRIPFLQQTEAAGHAVRANYLFAGAADLYAETGQEEYLNTLKTIWQNMAEKKLYITGGCGAVYDGASPEGASDQGTITRVHQAYGRNYQLPSITAHNETCANIANLLWSWRMFLLTGESKYVDVLEIALYNSILSGVSLEGTEYFYVNPLRVTDPLPIDMRFPRTRQPFFTSFCCPPNLLRTIAEVGGYAYAKSYDALYVNLYGSNQFSTELGRQDVALSQESNYPWNGRIRIEIEQTPATAWELRLRIPFWTTLQDLRVNGALIESHALESGYAVIRRNWQKGDVVEFDLPLPSRLVEANPLVEEATNQLAVMRGPVVYCLESQDLPSNLDINEIVLPRDATFQPATELDLPGGIVALEGKAIAVRQAPWDAALYREAKPTSRDPITLRLIPYFAWGNRGSGEMTVWLKADF